jgi:site-specific DNA-methyltransferase (adenine-specific)
LWLCVRWGFPALKPIDSTNFNLSTNQKPVKLYDWIFYKYAKEGMKILDTHLGSGSSRISANRYKLDFVGCEIDEEYFNKQNRRYADFISQTRLF